MRMRPGLLLLACLSLAPPLAARQEEPQQPPPAENPLPQETPVVEDPARQPEPPPPPPPVVPVTLGELVTRAATGLKLPAPEGGFTPESAAWALVVKGVKVRAEMGSPLTEADAVGLLKGLGYRIRTETPSRVMSRDRFEILVETFLSPAAVPPPAPAPSPAPTEGKP